MDLNSSLDPDLIPLDPNSSPSTAILKKVEPAVVDDEVLTPEDLVQGWNDVCVPLGLSRVAELSLTRREKAFSRLHEHPNFEWWETVFANIRGSPFLRGLMVNGNGNGKHDKFRCSFDWMIENDTNAVKIFEGKYAND